MKLELFESIKKLHDLELYDDLLLYAELNFHEHKLSDFLKIDEQAYIYMCIADAQYQTSRFTQSSKYYDRAIKSLAVMKRHNGENNFENVINAAELRFRMHKSLLKERKIDEAIRCLDGISKTDQTPKIQYAIAKLNLAHRKPTRPLTPFSTKITNNFRNIVEQVPEALLCKSLLILSGNSKSDDEILFKKLNNSETLAWVQTKQAEVKRNFPLAIQVLNKSSFSNHFKLAAELGHFYRLIGDRKKALECYERAHSLNTSLTYGMDSYAFLLAQSKMSRELEVLADNLMSSNPLSAESYIAYGHLARHRRCNKEALQFAQRAVNLASVTFNGRLKAESLLLRAIIYFDSKNREAETCLQEALINDGNNLDIYDTYIRYLVHQKRSSEAHRIAKNALNFLGEDNYRAQFLMAYLLAEDPNSINEAITLLELVTEKAPHIIDSIFLLARLYEKENSYEQGIKFIKKFADVNADAQVHRILGDFYAKTNQIDLACSEYRLALSAAVPDPKALLALNAINSSSVTQNNLTTPDFVANNVNSTSGNNAQSSVFNNRGPSAPVAPARMRRVAQVSNQYQARRTGNVTSPNAVRSSTSPTLDFFLPPRFDEAEPDEVVVGNNFQSCSSSSSIRNGRRSIETTTATSSSSTSTLLNSASLTSPLHGNLTTAVASSSSSLDSSEREMRLLKRNQRVGHRQRIPDSLRFRDKGKIRSIESQARRRSSTPTSTINSNYTSVESSMLNDDNLVDVTAEIDAMDHEFVALQDELIEEGILLGAAAATNDNINLDSEDLDELNANEDDNMSDNDNSNNRVLI